MKKLKIIFLLIFVLILVVLSFYFWGKQSNYSKDNYIKFVNKTEAVLKTTDTLNLMTYNIGYLSGMTNNLAVERSKELIIGNLDKSYKLIGQAKPHIIGLQEIDFACKRTYYLNQLDSLYEKLDFVSSAQAVNWDKKYVPFPYWPSKYHFGEMYSGQAVLSNSKVLRNSRIVLPQPHSNPFYYNDFYLDRLAQIVWLEFNDDRLLVINVHLEAWHGSTREKQIDIILDYYHKFEKEYPTIIMGDFNCPPPFSSNAFDEYTIEKLMNHPSLSMCVDQGAFINNEDPFYTYSSEKPYQKIDYIFYSTEFFSCIESRVLHEAGEISDHLPVYAKLVVKKTNQDY